MRKSVTPSRYIVDMAAEPTTPSIDLDGEVVHISALAIEDATLASLLRREPADAWESVLVRVLSVGARGVASMGLGVDLTEVDLRMDRSVRRLTDEAHRRADELLEAARKGFREELDPEVRSSIMARSLEEFQAWQGTFLASLDPSSSDSHTGRLVEALQQLVGPGGVFENRIAALFDLDAEGSALSLLSSQVDQRFGELRDLMFKAEGASQEAAFGTRKGLSYEQEVEDALRTAAMRLPGSYVECTSKEFGSLDANSRVGDFVVTSGAGHRIVVEAKNVAAISVQGKSGILNELDQAMANRRAEFAICVSAQDAFPSEVGTFRADGNRLLIVDDGDGAMISIALQWAVATLLTDSFSTQFDKGLVIERLARLRSLATQFSNTQRSLTKISSSVASVQSDLAEMRTELLATADDIASEVGRTTHVDGPGGEVIGLRAVAESTGASGR